LVFIKPEGSREVVEKMGGGSTVREGGLQNKPTILLVLL